MNYVPSKKGLLLDSALAFNSEVNSNSFIREWLENQKNSSYEVEQIPLNSMNSWSRDKNGNLEHDSKKFFSISGLEAATNWGGVQNWQQPILNQPEIGILGIITKIIEGKLHFLMQAKKEPGNINGVQISPTLQATQSNLNQVHKGERPQYFEFFQNYKKEDVFFDQLQSEQGGRFFRKRNRNIIIKVSSDVYVKNNFLWMTLGQIKLLLKEDNLINMDTRSVLAAITYHDDDNIFNTKNQISNQLLLNSLTQTPSIGDNLKETLMWMTELKSSYNFEVKIKSLSKVRNWIDDGKEIYHEENKYFSIIGVHSTMDGREIQSWDQPMMRPCQEGIIGFILKPVDGILHFLVQAKLEVGNIDIFELAPTVQTLTGDYKQDKKVPFLDNFLSLQSNKIISKSMQSEEGGRFFKEQNLNVLLMEDENYNPVLPTNFLWMPLSQILLFLKFNNYFNMSARSLISQLILD